MDPVRVGDRLPAEEVATGLLSGADGASSSGPLVWSEAENGGGGTKDGSGADISVVFTASGEDEAADPMVPFVMMLERVSHDVDNYERYAYMYSYFVANQCNQSIGAPDRRENTCIPTRVSRLNKEQRSSLARSITVLRG